MEDHRDAPRRLLEAILEPQPQILELIQRPLGALLVPLLEAGREAERFGFVPGHGYEGRAGSASAGFVKGAVTVGLLVTRGRGAEAPPPHSQSSR